MVKAVRGAISVDSNDHESMKIAVIALMNEVCEKNSLREEEMISVVFSQTTDLNVANPAAALRKSGAYRRVPLFCTQEPEYDGALNSIVRVLVTYQNACGRDPVPVYLGEAVHLRKDLYQSDEC